MKKIFILSILLTMGFSCSKNESQSKQTSKKQEYSKPSSNITSNQNYGEVIDEPDGELYNPNSESQNFNCDNESLTRIVEEKAGPIQNIITLNVNNELNTCECQAYAPNLSKPAMQKYVNSRGYYYKEGRKFGVMIHYNAQLKDNGEIVFNADY